MIKASLCTGIAGLDLAAYWAGMTTVVFCERDPFCQKVLRKHFPHVPIIDDVCNFTRKELERRGIAGAIDIISAGYPCQPFSYAGKRRGAEDDRHLWPEIIRIIKEIRPRWVVLENVLGHVTLGLDDVLDDLGGRVTPRKHLYFRLLPSVPAIDETGSSLWPTPQAHDATKGSADRVGRFGTEHGGRNLNDYVLLWPTPKARDFKHATGREERDSPDLNVMVKMWPTPRANDAKKRGNVSDDPRNGLPGAVRMWPTPHANCHTGAGEKGEGGMNIQTAVKMWPTPTTNDAKNATLPPAAKDWDIIPGALMREGYTSQEGQLNPEWVEALMNFPVGWTDVD